MLLFFGVWENEEQVNSLRQKAKNGLNVCIYMLIKIYTYTHAYHTHMHKNIYIERTSKQQVIQSTNGYEPKRYFSEKEI